MLPHDTAGCTACVCAICTHHAAPCKLDGSAAAAATDVETAATGAAAATRTPPAFATRSAQLFAVHACLYSV